MEEYEHLRQRFIRGEITVDEYERRLRALRRPLTQDDLERIAAARSRPAVGAFAVTPRRGSTAAPTSVPRTERRRRVRWYVPILGGCLMTIAALCGLGAAVGGIVGAFSDPDADDVRRGEAFIASSPREFAVAGQPTIRIDNEHGNVTVTSGPQGTVSVTAADRVPGTWATPFDVEQDGDSIIIDSDRDDGPFRSSPGGRSEDLVVTVPPASLLDIEVDQGDISIDKVTLSSDSSLRVDTGNIEIDGELAPDTELEVSVDSGDARFFLPRDADARVEAEVNSGSITSGDSRIQVSDEPDDEGAEASGDLGTDPTSSVEIDIDQGSITLSPRQ